MKFTVLNKQKACSLIQKTSLFAIVPTLYKLQHLFHYMQTFFDINVFLN